MEVLEKKRKCVSGGRSEREREREREVRSDVVETELVVER